jgi:hypothetical protein
VRDADLLHRWKCVSDLVRLVTVSTRVVNIETPLNLLLVGPPGDGKTRMVTRVSYLAHVETLSDTTYLGLVNCLKQVKDNLISTLVIPDLGTLVGRRNEVARQSIATLAMMTAEGVSHIRVGKQVRDFGGARCSLISAITNKDLDIAADVLEQNAFLSRMLLVDFDLSFAELEFMLRRKHEGNRKLIASLSFRRAGIRKTFLPPRAIRFAPTYAKWVRQSWTDLKRHRQDRFFGFRSADFLQGLLQSSAYLRGSNHVAREDIVFVRERILPLVMKQIQQKPEGT